MKTTNKFLALALVAVAMGFASCSKDDDSAQKVAENFSQDIIGMWEGVERTDNETNGNAEARIAYYTDGTYIHYRKIADVWFPRFDDVSEYNIEGNKLTSCWKPVKAENYSFEWWNIEAIKDGVMKWSARRENKDGSQYTATFTWKKVDDTLTSEQILAKLSGTWIYDEITQTTFLKGEVVDVISHPWVPQATFTFNSDGKYWFSFPNPNDATKKDITEYTYTIKGNVLTSVSWKNLVDGVGYDEHSIMGKKVVDAISDDELILIEYSEIAEVVENDSFDAFLMVAHLKRIEE